MIDFCVFLQNAGFIFSKLFQTFNFLFFPACCFLILFFGFFIKFWFEKAKSKIYKKTGIVFDEFPKKFRERFIELVTDDVIHFLNSEGHDLVDYLAKHQRKYLRDVHCFVEPSKVRVSIINHDTVSNTTIRILEIQGIEGCFDLEEKTSFIFNRKFKISGIRLKMVVVEANFFEKFITENKLYFFSMNKVLIRPEMPLTTILNGTKFAITVICPVGIFVPKNFMEIICQWKRKVPLHILELKNVPFDENGNFELLETFFKKFGNCYFYSFILWFDVNFDEKYKNAIEKQICKILKNINKKNVDNSMDLQLKISVFPKKKESVIYIYNQICDYKGNYWSKWIKNEDYLKFVEFE